MPLLKRNSNIVLCLVLKSPILSWWVSSNMLSVKHLECLIPHLIILINVVLWLELPSFFLLIFKLHYNKHIILDLGNEKYHSVETNERYSNMLKKYLVLKILKLLLIQNSLTHSFENYFICIFLIPLIGQYLKILRSQRRPVWYISWTDRGRIKHNWIF